MERVHPATAYEYGTGLKIQKIYKRDTYKPWTFSKAKYAVMVDIIYPEYNLYGWTYVGLGTTDEPTTYDTEEDARQFMDWIKDGCQTADEVEDIDEKHFKLKKK